MTTATKRRIGSGLAGLALAGGAYAGVGGRADETPLPVYKAAAGEAIRGTLSSVGSDSMNNLMTLWAEGFRRYYPDVKVQVEGKGSSTAPPALIEGVAQFGPMSRDMKNEEIDAFEKKYGYKPTRLRTALDALAVFVHKDNPVESLSMAQVDAIFSQTRKAGHAEDVVRWGQVGMKGDWANASISLYGRNAASGTYGYFKEHALRKGDFRPTVKEQPGSASVVQGVAEDRFAIGYSGIGYTTPNVRAVPLASKDGARAYAANLENVIAETYPLGRYLNVYINRAPGKPLDPVVREFCRFVFSREGQEVVAKDGYLPLPAAVVEKERKLLE